MSSERSLGDEVGLPRPFFLFDGTAFLPVAPHPQGSLLRTLLRGDVLIAFRKKTGIRGGSTFNFGIRRPLTHVPLTHTGILAGRG